MKKITDRQLKNIKVGITFTPETMMEWIYGLEKINQTYFDSIYHYNNWEHANTYSLSHDQNGYSPHYF